MREEMTRVGFVELATEQKVDAALGGARPGMALALQQGAHVDNRYTVFAGQDEEATAKARTCFAPYPPSSPSMAVLKDGTLAAMVERSQIEGTSPQVVAARVLAAVR
ncbi:MAG TPA: BrxA/BrxB family bacilliredoxin [Symbiobacteriaceae bacterium]|nr:BrxA/BrxB family bacilliredoxin [Symbiobacteriaceae bacterium]